MVVATSADSHRQVVGYKTDTNGDLAALARDPALSVDKRPAPPKTATSGELSPLDRLEVHLWPRHER